MQYRPSMPRRGFAALVLPVLVLMAGIATASAHHTFVTKYDSARQLTISGTIGNVRYANPHIFFDVTGKNGATWTVETEGILAARAKGLTEGLLKEGAQVTVTGWAGRDKAAEMGLKSITFSGGRSISMRNTAR